MLFRTIDNMTLRILIFFVISRWCVQYHFQRKKFSFFFYNLSTLISYKRKPTIIKKMIMLLRTIIIIL